LGQRGAARLKGDRGDEEGNRAVEHGPLQIWGELTPMQF
jgi:hypothetical protein